MTSKVNFECMVLAGFTELDRVVLDDETAAVEWARARLSPIVTQVTIEACAGDVATFAIRHLHPDGTDSGWSCWFAGDKVNIRSIDVLFAERRPRLFLESQLS